MVPGGLDGGSCRGCLHKLTFLRINGNNEPNSVIGRLNCNEKDISIYDNAFAGPVPHAQVAAEVGVLRQRQHAAGGGDAPLADDDRAVVQRGLDEKDVAQQLARDVGVDDGAAG